MSDAPIRMLLVEDEEADYLVTRAQVEQLDRPPVRMDWVQTYGEARDALTTDEYDVFLVDFVLADGSGLDLLRDAVELGSRTPMIMLTGKGSLQVDLEAMAAGAADYLVKGTIDPPLLERSIRYALERRNSDDALRASEEKLRTLFDRLPLGLYRITPEGEFLDANPALIRLLGYPNSETLKTVYSPQLYVREGDQARFRADLEADGVVLGLETDLKRRDGEIIHVRNSARLHRDAQGRPEYIEGALEDVTDIERARRVSDSEAHYRAIVDATKSGVLVLALEGTVVEANAATGDVFGCPAEDLEDRPLDNLFVSDDRDGIAADLATARAHYAGRVESDRRIRRMDGTVLWARVCLTPVLDSAGQPFHLLCLLEDVAETPEDDDAV